MHGNLTMTTGVLHLCNRDTVLALWQCTNYRCLTAARQAPHRKTRRYSVEMALQQEFARQKKPSLKSTRVENRSDDYQQCALLPWGNELALQKIPWRSREYHNGKFFATGL
jgi:hypothetical protein